MTFKRFRQLGSGLLGIILGIALMTSSVLADSISSASVRDAASAQRQSSGLHRLQWDNGLYRNARDRFMDMQRYCYWSHNNPVTGRKWFSFNYYYLRGYRVSENIARGQSRTQLVIDQWLASGSHRAVLLSPNATKFGVYSNISTCDGRQYTFLLTADVGQPTHDSPLTLPAQPSSTPVIEKKYEVGTKLMMVNGMQFRSGQGHSYASYGIVRPATVVEVLDGIWKGDWIPVYAYQGGLLRKDGFVLDRNVTSCPSLGCPVRLK